MDQIIKNRIIKSLEDGDWSLYGDTITRNDLMDYLLDCTNPTISEKGMKIKTLPKIECPLCGHPTKPQAFSLTHRAVKYLLCAVYLSSEDMKLGDKGNDGYVHHELIHDLCQGKFAYDKGKRLGKGISFTSYSTLTRAPWDLLKSQVDTNDKKQRNGCFKPTEKCLDFLRGKISLPLRIELLDATVVRYSKGMVNAATAKDINWKQCIDIYKTF